jgi:predicted TIM-barrel fold metal-dependent hydrolase
MDIQGIDQVMIIPTEIDIYPWLEDALGAKAFCRAYNEWAYEYTRENPDRLYFAALIPMQHPDYAVQEIHRVAALGCRVALVRPMDAMGNYPLHRNTSRSGMRSKRPVWSTACTRSRPLPVRSRRAIASNIPAPN